MSDHLPVRRARPVTRLVGLLLAGVVALAIGEGIAGLRERPVVATRLYFDASNDAYRLHRPAPGALGYELRPGVRFGDVAVNALGLRGEETTRRKPAGRRRVLLLGDSITLAAGLPIEHSYGGVLERELEARGVPAEVLNAGVIGYNARQEALWFERHGAALEPDLVIVGVCLNDLGGTETHELEGERWRVDVMVPAMVPLGLADGPVAVEWTARSALLRALQGAAHRLRGSPESTRLFDPQEHANLAAYRGLAEQARAAGASLALVLFPLLAEPDEGWRLTHARLRAIAAELELPLLDLGPVYAAHPFEELRISPGDPWHPNRLGHALAGESLATFLLDHELIAPP